MLPKTGTRERDLLETETLLLGEKFLEEADGDFAIALYEVYSHLRYKLLNERGLSDSRFEDNPLGWDEALADAETLRKYLCHTWASKALA